MSNVLNWNFRNRHLDFFPETTQPAEMLVPFKYVSIFILNTAWNNKKIKRLSYIANITNRSNQPGAFPEAPDRQPLPIEKYKISVCNSTSRTDGYSRKISVSECWTRKCFYDWNINLVSNRTPPPRGVQFCGAVRFESLMTSSKREKVEKLCRGKGPPLVRWKLLATAPDDLAEKGFQTNAPSTSRGRTSVHCSKKKD